MEDRKVQHWPGCYYGPDDQVEIFNSPLEVPEGWHDHPSKVDDPKAKTVIPGYAEAVAAAETEQKDDADEEELEDADDEAAAPAETASAEADAGEDGATASEGAGAEAAELTLPPVDDMSKDDITCRLLAMKLTFNVNWGKDRLYNLLKDNFGGAEEAE